MAVRWVPTSGNVTYLYCYIDLCEFEGFELIIQDSLTGE